MLKTNKTFGLKGFLFMCLAALVASTAITACSDDDDSQSNDNSTITEEQTGELESIRNQFLYTDTAGVSHVVLGVALDKNFPDVRYLGVEDSIAAIVHFRNLMAYVDSTHFTYNVDGSIVVTPTDSLGNSQGNITFAFASAGSGKVATVTFEPEDMVPGVSQLNYILSSQWPTNASTPHYRGRKVTYTVPRVRYDAGNSVRGYLDPKYTKTVELVCANTPVLEGDKAYYVYFDNVKFSPERTFNIDSKNKEYMKNNLATRENLCDAIYKLVFTQEIVYCEYNPTPGAVYDYNYEQSDILWNEAIAMGVNLQDTYYYTSSTRWVPFKTYHYARNPKTTRKECYWTNNGIGEFVAPRRAVEGRTDEYYRKRTHYTYYGETSFDGEVESEYYPYAVVVVKNYEEDF